MTKVQDLIGIGFGPNNIGLAVLAEEYKEPLDMLFLEAREEVSWQPGMMLSNTDIQHSPHLDFVSPINPRSRYTFLNYLKENGRLLSYLNLPAPFPFRKELSLYVQWVASFFTHFVRFGESVVSIDTTQHQGEKLFKVTTTAGQTYLGRAVALGTGGLPQIPDVFRPHVGERVFHLTEYLSRVPALIENGKTRFAIIGSGQSAAELTLDIHERSLETTVHTITRGIGFRQKDLSPFTENIYSPDFEQWFQRHDESQRTTINSELRDAVYGRADKDVLDALYRKWYQDLLEGSSRIKFENYADVKRINTFDRKLQLILKQRFGDATRAINVDAVVLATGFKNLEVNSNPLEESSLLTSVADRIVRNPSGSFYLNPDYSLSIEETDGNRLPIYMNSCSGPACGIGNAGTFPLLAYRAETIALSIAGRKPTERSYATA